MSKFSLVTLFGLTIISALHTSFSGYSTLSIYCASIIQDLDQQLGSNSQQIFVQNANNGNASNQGATTAATALKQHAAAQDYYRNNIVLRTAVLNRIDTYFGRFYGYGIPLVDIPGSTTIQEFRQQMEFPPDDE